jgi:hypothetical protein
VTHVTWDVADRFLYSWHGAKLAPGTAMKHSRLTQWIEDVEARQYLLAATWRYAPPAVLRSLRLGKTILKVPAQVRYAAAQALSHILRPPSNG